MKKKFITILFFVVLLLFIWSKNYDRMGRKQNNGLWNLPIQSSIFKKRKLFCNKWSSLSFFFLKKKESSQYDIKNLVWEKIPAKEVFGLIADNVSTKEIAYSNSQKQTINGQFLTNVGLPPLKKYKNTLYRLTSFELVKKTVNNQRTSRTSDLIGTTENPLKSGNFYKIKSRQVWNFQNHNKILRDNGINPSSINPKISEFMEMAELMLPEFNQDFRYAALQENAIQVIGEEDGKWDENDYALFYAQRSKWL